MPFNSITYRANKYRRAAWDELRQAREIKARVLAGTAYEWEASQVALFVMLARNSMRLHLGWRSMGR
jgi:hypothetical protein